ncbi:hypothetical protein [Streptomyces sp. MS2.AVA.5]|uniref:Uncharacterized protein n=1 Tax=Streptomyces achmelvichensis TaxID=3134111 RepID=A0ACC6Q851_9ACTN
MSTPDDNGSSFADDTFTSGDTVAFNIDKPNDTCLLSAQVLRDERGFNLCLVEDPDSGCSDKELLHHEPATPNRGKRQGWAPAAERLDSRLAAWPRSSRQVSVIRKERP